MAIPRGVSQALLVLVCLLLYLPGAWRRDFWVPDEPRYAAIVENMTSGGGGLLLRLNGELYTDKPPLWFWALQLLRRVAGAASPPLYALPSTLAAIATVLLVERAGRRWLGSRAGFPAALVLATSGLWLGLAQAVRMDLLLALLVAIALTAFLDGWLEREARPGRWLPWRFWVALGLATLTKGAVGLVVPLLVVLAFLASRRALGEVARLRHLAGLGLALGIIGAWLVPALLAGGEPFARAVFLQQTLHRAVRSWAHAAPVWFYLERLPLAWFPWLPLLLAALLERPEGDSRTRDARAFLIAWAGVWLGFFSLVSGKLEVYLLPMFPALALLVGDLAGRALAPAASSGERRRFGLAQAVLGVALLALGAMLLGGGFGDATYLQGRVAPFLFVVAGTTGLVASLLDFRRIAFLYPIAFMAAVLAYAVVALVPAVDATYSGRSLAHRLGSPGAPVPRLATLRVARPELSWWLGTSVPTLRDAHELDAFVASGQQGRCLARRDDFEALRHGRAGALLRGEELQLGHERLVLIEPIGRP